MVTYNLPHHNSVMSVLFVDNAVMFVFTDCPSGTHWDSINGCATCPFGTYMEHPNRANNCTECPEMTTTIEEGSVSEQDCVGEYVYTKREPSWCHLCRATGGTTTGFGKLKTNDCHDANCIVTCVNAGSYRLKNKICHDANCHY